MATSTTGIREPSDDLKLRIGAIFVILATSALGSVLPILSKRYHGTERNSKESRSCMSAFAPKFFDFTKYLGSGIIIATAFVHLLSPAFEELKDPSLPAAWLQYDWAPVLAMTAVFFIFTVELLAYRIGTSWLQKLGVTYDAHDHSHSSHGPCEPDEAQQEHQAGHTNGHIYQEPSSIEPIAEADDEDTEHAPLLHKDSSVDSRPSPTKRRFSSQRQLLYGTLDCQRPSGQHSASKRRLNYDTQRNMAASIQQTTPTTPQSSTVTKSTHPATQVIAVAILEIGVVLHSFIIGMTLAVVERFPTLFVVITLHQMFEGLGLGARLAGLSLPKRLSWVPLAAAFLYSAITPVGLALGLIFRKAYSPQSPAGLIVSGVLDSLSAGILLYTGLVELLCAEFLFHQEMREAPTSRVLYALGCVILGAIAMSVLGIWA